MDADTYQPPKHGWTCFYCGETFNTTGSAADHFGNNMHTAEPGCLIDYRVQVEEGGKPERGRGLLMALRKAEAELARYREEDTDLHRQIHGVQSAHYAALMREEEKGYARGLRDGVNLPADSPERAALAGVALPDASKLVSLWFDEWELILPPDARESFRNDLLPSVRAAGVKAPDSALSDFIRNASPEQKAEVYGKVMGKVAVRQQAVIDGVKENGNG